MSEGCYDDAKKYLIPEVGIYKRKQELDKESDQEKKVFSSFLDRFLVESVFSILFS